MIEQSEITALSQISEGRRQLALAGDDIQAITTLRDKAMAAQIFAAAQGYKEAAQEAKIFQLQAERKAGDWLRENVSHNGGNPQLSQDVTVLPEGIDRMESSRWQLEAALPEEKFNEWVDESLAKGWEISAAGLRNEAKNYLRLEARAEVAEKAETVEPSERWHIYHADIQKWQAPRQYDFIITDPPYPKEFLHLYEVLAYRAKEWLKPGGLLIAMCGQSYLDEIYAMMSKHVPYYWTAAYLTPGQPTPLRQRQVNTTWKPLLMFGDYNGKIFGDVFKSDGNDKDFHKWGQSVSGMYDIISKICLPGQSILDPFCGAGTTGIAALKHGCLFDGLDVDEQNVKISIGRLGSDGEA